MEGNWITANLEAAIEFFNSMMTFMYEILTINPVTYRDGVIWDVTNTIYDALLGSALSLMVIFIYLGLIEDMGEYIKHKNWGPFIWSFIKCMIGSGILIYGRHVLIWIFSIGKEFVDKIALKNGVNIIQTMTWATVPEDIIKATDNLNLASGIVFWVVTLVAAIVVMVVCFSILLTIYGRIFKIYLHIAISPLAFACFASRTTMNHFLTFIKSFVAVILEGLIIIVACMIFSAFANNFDIYQPMENVVAEESTDEGLSDEELFDSISDAVESGSDAVDAPDDTVDTDLNAKTENATQTWLYIGETLFLFILMASVIKGANDTVKTMLGV